MCGVHDEGVFTATCYGVMLLPATGTCGWYCDVLVCPELEGLAVLWVVEGTGPGRHAGQDPGNQGPGARTHGGSHTHTHLLHTVMFFTLLYGVVSLILFTLMLFVRLTVSYSSLYSVLCITVLTFFHVPYSFHCITVMPLALFTPSRFCLSFYIYCHVPHSIIPVVFDPLTLPRSCLCLTPSLTHPDTTPHHSLSQHTRSPTSDGYKRDTPGFQLISL